MSVIKLNRDELDKEIRELDSLNDRVSSILRESEKIGSMLRSVKDVSVSSQKRTLENMQDNLYNLSRKFEDMCDDLFNAVRAYDQSEEKINRIVEKNLGFDNAYKSLLVTSGEGSSILKKVENITESSFGDATITGEIASLYDISRLEIDDKIAEDIGQASIMDTSKINNVLRESSLDSVSVLTSDLKSVVRQSGTFTGNCVQVNAGEVKPLYTKEEDLEAEVNSYISTKIDDVKSVCSEAGSWIKEILSKLTAKIESYFEAFKEKFSEFTDKLTSLCERFLGEEITANITDKVKTIYNKLTRFIEVFATIEVALAADIKNVFLSIAKGCVKVFGGSEETMAEIDSLRESSDIFLEQFAMDKDIYNKAKVVIDYGSYLIPYFGAGRAIFEAFTGINAVTGEEMGALERVLSILSVVGVGVLFKAGKKVLIKIGGKALSILEKGGSRFLARLEKAFPKLMEDSGGIAKVVSENYTKLVGLLDDGYSFLKNKTIDFFKGAGAKLKAIKDKSIELLKNAGKFIDDICYKFGHAGAELIRKGASFIDDFIADAKALVSYDYEIVNGSVVLKRGAAENTGSCRKAAEDFISYAKGNIDEVKRVIIKPKYLERVSNLYDDIAKRGLSRDCSFEELCEIYNKKGANPKFTQKEIAAAHYKYTGKTDMIDLIDYQKILKDDGRAVSQAGVKKGEAKNHAHHICYKRGQDGVVNDLAMQGQEILKRYDIDPVLDPHNLVPAPNKGHSEANIREVLDGLRDAEEVALARCEALELGKEEKIQFVRENLYDELKRLGKIAQERR